MLFTKHTPYTYIIGWSKLDTWYYGRRTAKGCHPDDFWVKYFTSSVFVDEFRKLHGEPDIRKIHKTFSSSDVHLCVEQEKQFLRNVNAVSDSRWLNRDYGDRDTTGMAAVRNVITGEFTLIPVDELSTSSQFVGANHGITHKTTSCKFCDRLFGINNIKIHEETCRDNPNRIPGRLAGRKLQSKSKACKFCGRIGAKHGISRHENVCAHNPNRIEHTSTGMTYELVTICCSYCDKVGNKSAITRHERCCDLNPNKNSNMLWVYDELGNQRVSETQLPSYLAAGFSRGRGPKGTQKRIPKIEL